MRNLLLAVCGLLLLSALAAQTSTVAGLFPTVDLSGKMATRWDYTTYYFGAFPPVNLSQHAGSEVADALLVYAEQGLAFTWKAPLTLGASYVFQLENLGQENRLREHRLHFEATARHAVGKARMKHRVRFDNRFIHSYSTGSTDYKHRIRYLLGGEIPLGNDSYVAAYEEAFFTTHTTSLSRFSENWAAAAFGTRFPGNMGAEVGPLYIAWRTGPDAWLHQLYLQLTWKLYLDSKI